MITGALAVGSAAFGQGTGPIFLDRVECAGCEEFLLDCPILVDENSTCQHDHDAGVICPGQSSATCSQSIMYTPFA